MAVEPVKAKGAPKKPSLRNSNNWYRAKPQASSIGNGPVLKKLGFERFICTKKIEPQNVIPYQA